MQDTFERRQAILNTLSFRRFETMANLAKQFHVSVRTIQRDINILSNSAQSIPSAVTAEAFVL